MTDDEQHLLEDCAYKLVGAQMVDGPPDREVNRFVYRMTRSMRVGFDLRRDCGVTGLATWSGEVARAALRTCNPGTRGHDGVAFGKASRDAMIHFAMLRVAHAVAMGHADGLEPDERRLARQYAAARFRDVSDRRDVMSDLDRVRLGALTLPEVTPAASPADGFPVPAACGFSFAWPRPVGARTSPTLARGWAPMRVVAGADAPVACRLVAAAGGRVDVRAHDGGFLRPVLRPSTWEPIGAEEFLAAADDGRRWADNPFVPHPRNVPVCSLPELASTARGRPEAETAAAAARVAVVGTLTVVDGIVHRTCPPPRACLVLDDRGKAKLSWTIPGQLDETDDQLPLRLRQHDVLRLDPAAPGRWSRDAEHRPCATRPLTEAGSLLEMARDVLAEAERPEGTSPPPFDVLLPEAWRDVPGWRAAATEDLLASLPEGWVDVEDRREAVADALGALRRGDGGGTEVARLAEALDADERTRFAGSLLWHLSDRPEPDHDLDDEEVSGMTP